MHALSSTEMKLNAEIANMMANSGFYMPSLDAKYDMVSSGHNAGVSGPMFPGNYGGVAANGGNYWKGLGKGAIIALCNDALHDNDKNNKQTIIEEEPAGTVRFEAETEGDADSEGGDDAAYSGGGKWVDN